MERYGELFDRQRVPAYSCRFRFIHLTHLSVYAMHIAEVWTKLTPI